MDEKTLNELLECSVCLERLDSTSKVLPCQHTFCKRCLEEIYSTKHELQCPECRSYVTIPIQDLPSNILLIRLLEGMKTVAVCSGSNPTSPLHAGAHSGSSHRATASAKPIPTSSPCAKALYNYDANEHGDLSFKKGDVILLRKQVDENWYHGELNGLSGFFPATYVQVLTGLPQHAQIEAPETPKCTALYDFAIGDKNEKDCLPFHKDDSITVIRRVDENWAEGKLADRIGIFPISFVEMNEAAKYLMDKQSSHPNNQPSTRSVPTTSASSSASSSSSSSSSSSPTSSTSPTSSPDDASPPPAVVSLPLVSFAAAAVAMTTGVTVTVTSSTGLAVGSSALLTAHQQRIAQKRHSLTFTSPSSAAFSPDHLLHPTTATTTQHQRHSMEISTGSMEFSAEALSSAAAALAAMGTGPVMSTAGASALTTSTVSMPKSGPRVSSIVTSSPTHHTHMTLYKAQYNYKPQKEDELELKKGELYTVTEKHQDGWYKGQSIKESKVGVFPGNYVGLVRISTGGKSASVIAAAAHAVGGGRGSAPCSPPHTAVTRTHSFPKTSMPHHHMAQPTRPNVTLSHTRTITNVTQAQTRSMAAASRTTTSTCSAVSTVRTDSCTAATSSSSRGGGARNSPTSSPITSATTSTSSSSPPPPPAHARTHSSSNSTADTADTKPSSSSSSSCRSPHSVRKHHHHHQHHYKHPSSSSSSSRGPAAGAMSLTAANVTITPPNVVLGAAAASQTKKEQSEKRKEAREHRAVGLDRLNLMKRLTSASKSSSSSSGSSAASNSRKCKSPPPESATAAAASSSESEGPRPTHQRTSSLPNPPESERGAAAAAPSVSVPHKKTVPNTVPSATAATEQQQKPAKVKPLVRERFRCIVPYPAQSEIDLELKVGDVVFVYKKKDDGWYKGTLQRTGKTGIFPQIFVEKF